MTFAGPYVVVIDDSYNLWVRSHNKLYDQKSVEIKWEKMPGP